VRNDPDAAITPEDVARAEAAAMQKARELAGANSDTGVTNLSPSDPSGEHERYLTLYERLVTPPLARCLSYEELAVEFATSALRASAYLNGGGLIAIPAAVALFKADVSETIGLLLRAAACWGLGLLLVTIAYALGFYAMARRAEMHELIASKWLLLWKPHSRPPRMLIGKKLCRQQLMRRRARS
jgi:hypothetical protein